MSNRQLVKAIQKLFRQVRKLSGSRTKEMVNWFLRVSLVTQRKFGSTSAGFVLPTTVLLLLVVTLTVGAMTYRAFNRSSQAIGERTQTVIYNAATPVMDRAKAKVEYMLRKDPRLPGGVPSDANLESLMLNNGTGGFTTLRLDPSNPNSDPYTLPDEQRIDINPTVAAGVDNAWTYQVDANGDGRQETVAYSVVLRDSNGAVNVRNSTDAAKAPALVTRNGPINLGGSSANPNCPAATRNPAGGWYPDGGNTAKLLKSIQINAVVVDANAANRTVTTLELQQDRQIDAGNKWGAWFRNDLEIFPGPAFRWNGAMHTRGNLMIGDSSSFTGFMISSQGSCVYRQNASEVTITEESGFKGQMVAGSMKTNAFSGSSNFHVFTNLTSPPTQNNILGTGEDSITNQPAGGVAAIALDPKLIVTEDKSAPRVNGAFGANTWRFTNNASTQRIFRNFAATPYLDDTYRADNRYGPKPVYSSSSREVADGTKRIGEPIDRLTRDELTREEPPAGATEAVGLDGYWERRARVEGLRLIVGQRLELGNPYGWVTPVDNNADGDTLDNTTGSTGGGGQTFGSPLPPFPAVASSATPPLLPEMWGDSLYPADRISNTPADRQHEARQRRALRDNLAAVQSSAVYQWDVNRTSTTGSDYPMACLASTVHPGTPQTLDRSTNFVPITFSDGTAGGVASTSLISNFFLGRGTNGWEFDAPRGNQTDFINDITTATSDLRKGLRNLSRFAGDPRGAFPALQESLGTGSGGTNRNIIHPYPRATMWGDFSELRRVVDLLDGVNADGTTTTPTAYSALSPADKTVLHTAACTLGMLAYNVRTVESFNPANPGNQTINATAETMTRLADAIVSMTDNTVATGNGEIAAPLTGNSGTDKLWQQFRYSSLPPEAYIERLKQAPYNHAPDSPVVRLAELLYLNYQVRRDRLYGFRGSPAYLHEFDDDVASLPNTRVPLACNPDDFNIVFSGSGPLQRRRRLGLARLCGQVRFKSAITPSRVAATPDNNDANQPFRYDGIDIAPRFPSLYYLFPRVNHDHDGAVWDTTNGAANTADGLYQAHGVAPKLLTPQEEASGTVLWTHDIDHRQPGNTNLPDRLGVGALVAATLTSTAPYNPLLLSTQGTTETAFNPTVNLPPEPYVVDPNIRGVDAGSDPTATVPSTFNYEKVDLAAVQVLPRNLGGAPSNNRSNNLWTLPTGTFTAGTTPNGIVNTSGTRIAVPFLDKAIFNGREIMNVRVMDLDLDLMRRNRPGTSSDTLLPGLGNTNGIIYAFREDAVREDEIARPAVNRVTPLAGEMRATLGLPAPAWNPGAVAANVTPTDPTINTNGISIKSVDYYGDPDRRPYGFRLRNGVDLRRAPGGSVDAANSPGMSFISDNPVYLQGDFNHHSTNGTTNPANRLEEFTNQLDVNWTNFYNRTSAQIDQRFADPLQDSWRPTEIIADAITILSNNFTDGTVEDGFRRTGTNSYSNQRRPTNGAPSFYWLQENPWTTPTSVTAVDGQNRTPIAVSRNGNPLYCDLPNRDANFINTCTRIREWGVNTTSGALNGGYDTSGTVPGATETRINAIIVSGIVPSQAQQSYGGFHNFPRFIEAWGGNPLNISGSFLQLNFSNYATAPFDQDALEPGSTPGGNEDIPYYGPPPRRWGYDVGLQYAPAGPVSRRFITPGSSWSEAYRELPVEDPYVKNLRCANLPSGSRVDPVGTCP
jgi:hypothetical protein